MYQRSVDFTHKGSNPLYLQLDTHHRQSLIDLMAALITHVFHEQENIHPDRTQQSNPDQY